MSPNDITASIQSVFAENDQLKRRLEQMQENCIDATKFYASSMTIEAVAKLHDVHPDTIRKYIALGLIEKHPKSTDSKILIRGSEALKLDFKKLKKYAKNPKSRANV